MLDPRRRGIVTSSQIGRIMKKGRGSADSKMLETYAMELAVAKLTTYEKEICTQAMEWGKVQELPAIAEFKWRTDLEVRHTGDDQKFLLSQSPEFGGTPDGIGTNFIIEVKCPNSLTHWKYYQCSKVEDCDTDYYWQMMSNMYLANVDIGYFISYDPRFHSPNHQIKIIELTKDDTAIEKMIEKIELVNNLRDSYAK